MSVWPRTSRFRLPAVFFVLPFIPTLEVKPVSKARRINVNVVVFLERAMGSG